MCAHNSWEPLKDNEKEIICRNAGRSVQSDEQKMKLFSVKYKKSTERKGA